MFTFYFAGPSNMFSKQIAPFWLVGKNLIYWQGWPSGWALLLVSDEACICCCISLCFVINFLVVGLTFFCFYWIIDWLYGSMADVCSWLSRIKLYDTILNFTVILHLQLYLQLKIQRFFELTWYSYTWYLILILFSGKMLSEKLFFLAKHFYSNHLSVPK